MADAQVTDAPVSDQIPQDSAPPQAASQPQAEQAEFASPYDAFSHLPEFQGREPLDIARALYRSHTGLSEAQRQLQQYQQIQPELHDWLQNKRQYMEWQASQRAAQQPQPEAQKKWFSPPEINDSWKQYIVRDPQTGREVIDPSAPYEAQQRLREYQDYMAGFARKLVTDPENTLKPFIEQVAQQKAEELVRQNLGQYTAESYVQQLEQQNADWLYDEQGNVTPYGVAIQHGIEEARQLGINGAEARWKYATSMLQKDLLAMRYQQMSAQAQQLAGAQQPSQQNPASDVASRDMSFLKERAVRTPNRSAGTTEPRAPQQRMSFEDRLRSQLERDGVS